MAISFAQLVGLFSLLYFVVRTLLKWHSRLLRPLDDKAVLITGCDSGFGHELACMLDEKGVTVFAGCLFPDGPGASQLKSICSEKLQILHLDVTDDDHVHNAVKTISCSLGDNKLWAVINNAGIATIGEVEWTPLERFQKMYNVNTLGALRVTKAFLPLLRRFRGRIIFVTSFAGYFTLPGVSAYSMSKSSLVSLADALRGELRKWSISVHTVSPTLYRTNMSSEEALMKELSSHWSQLPEDIRNEYDGTFLARYQVAVSSLLRFGRPETAVYEVVMDLLHAAIGVNPKIRYVPGLEPKVHNLFLTYVPTLILDWIIAFVLPGY